MRPTVGQAGGIAAAIAIAASLVGAGGAAAGSTVGSDAIEPPDPFYPQAGNGGYDVSRYEVDLNVRNRSREITARTEIDATSTQTLSRFNLDYDGPRIRSIAVEGQPANWERDGKELVVAPAATIPDATAFEAVVRYRGRPRTITEPDGSSGGWHLTDDGSFVAGEPQGAAGWFPANDHPRDKASFLFEVTVPRKTKAIANGSLVSITGGQGRRTWTWDTGAEEMATYLATLVTGRFSLDTTPQASIPSWIAVDKRTSGGAIGRTGETIELFEPLFGDYPFASTGGIVDRASVGYALETQTRPVYDGTPGAGLVAHEIAHQWFGDLVALRNWQDIWLNEGFAEWSQWRWGEDEGGSTTAQRLDSFCDDGPYNPPPRDLEDASELFANSVYDRGAATLQALKEEVGDSDFFAILQQWVADAVADPSYRATTDDFIALAETVSGEELSAFFADWLETPGKPAGCA
jgi:aminopeptidase N